MKLRIILMKNIEVLKAQIEALEKDVLKIKLKTEDLFWKLGMTCGVWSPT